MDDLEKKSIGFVGIGVMGQGMASNLMRAGYPLHVYTRTKHKVETELKQGAVWHETVAKIVQNSDVIITMVGYPSDVEEIYLSDYGIARHAKAWVIPDQHDDIKSIVSEENL